VAEARRSARGARGGADWRQIRALLSAEIKLDLRTSRSQLGRGRLPPFVTAMLVYAAMGTLLALALVAMADPFVFALFTMSGAMFLTALSVIMEYGSVVVSPDDYGILAHRPISSRTYFWSKVGNLFFYVGATALALTAPASVIGSTLIGGGWSFAAAYLPLAVLACLAASGVVVLVYTSALRVVSYERFTSIVTYVHMLATIVLALGYVALPNMIGRTGGFAVERGTWTYAAPPAWFAGAVNLLAGDGVPQDGLLTVLAAAFTVAAVGAAMNVISLDYSRRISELASKSGSTPPKRAGRASAALLRLGAAVCRTDEERAGYQLAAIAMRRDRKLRGRVYPAFGLPIAIIIFGYATGNLGDPFAPIDVEGFRAHQLIGAYCIFITIFFATAIVQSDQWKASWIFYAAPVRRLGDLLVGARKLIIWRYLLPFYALLLVVLSFAMPPAHAALYMLIITLLALTAFALLSITAPAPPLSQAVERTRQARQFGLVALGGLAMGLFVAVERLMQEVPISRLYVVIFLAALAAASEWVLRKSLAHKLARLDFAG